MNKWRLYIVLLTCLLILPCSKDVIGADWRYCCSSKDMTWYYDAESINFLPNNIIKVSIKMFPNNTAARLKWSETLQKSFGLDIPPVPANYTYTLTLYEFNCKNNMWDVLVTSDYNDKDEVINTIEKFIEPRTQYVQPDSIIYLMQKTICSMKDLKK